MADISENDIAALKAAHPGVELHLITVGDDRTESIVVKTPDRTRWMRFKEQAADKNRRSAAFEALVHDCTVWPRKEDVMARIEARPALAESFGGQIVELAGLEETVVAKKL